MHPLRNLSIRHKLNAIILMTCTAVLILTLAAFIFFEQRSMRQAFLEKNTTLAEVIGFNSTASLAFQDHQAAETTLAALSAESDIVSAAIISKDGQVFAAYRGKNQGVKSLPNKDRLPLSDSCKTDLCSRTDSYCFYPDYLDVVRRIEYEGDFLGLVMLRASLIPLQARLRLNILIGAGFLIISLILAYLLSARFQRVISRPISRLAQTMKAVSEEQNYTVKAVKHSDDELGKLIDGFNDMIAQIEKRDAELERHRHHLAEQVTERTAELLIINQELEEAVQALQLAREESATAQALLTAAIQQTPAGILISGAPKTNIRLINDAALEILARTDDETVSVFSLASLSHWQFYHPDGSSYQPEDLPLPQALRLGKSFCNEEMRIVREDGTERWVLINSSPIRNQAGEIVAGIVVFPDITGRKRAWEEKAKLEAQLQQSQKMEAIGTLAGGVAHDFNNLLQAILGYTQMLLLDKQLGDRGLESLREIDKAAQRAAELTQQLLAFSRKVESRLRPLDLNHQVKEVARLLRRTIPKMIDIHQDLAGEARAINADPVQLEQVMLNLALNARDAMPEGGKLSFTTTNVILDKDYCRDHFGVNPGPYVCLTVADTGGGMDEKTLAHIFEPFFTTKATGKGTGLGLAMVYGIVQNHHGHITCESEPNRGTAFKVYFPAIAHEAAPTAAPETTITFPAGGTETILVVDDEENLRQLSHRMLSRFGYNLLFAASGEEALEIYQQERDHIDLVLLDLIMPGMGGERCLTELRKLNPHLKVILASGVAQELNAQEAGANGILPKPYRLQQILQVVRQVLGTPGGTEEL